MSLRESVSPTAAGPGSGQEEVEAEKEKDKCPGPGCWFRLVLQLESATRRTCPLPCFVIFAVVAACSRAPPDFLLRVFSQGPMACTHACKGPKQTGNTPPGSLEASHDTLQVQNVYASRLSIPCTHIHVRPVQSRRYMANRRWHLGSTVALPSPPPAFSPLHNSPNHRDPFSPIPLARGRAVSAIRF
ncbi:hypothetical protein GGS23DRAFT_544828 [Durotheca rogersii]|uniref:uncharacterized protein n=1 Tax=Durotheca rogersii TaxID=419775 RepID=UPI002220C333|nr:uncharacterized protein GGS23DRAFT_544828 [Durotheca rogersii]KAI5868294.1 hypothetical protein GGS23DRAFT_544828 [Durotheca rogersii]